MYIATLNRCMIKQVTNLFHYFYFTKNQDSELVLYLGYNTFLRRRNIHMQAYGN
jgi:hypothetical protein